MSARFASAALVMVFLSAGSSVALSIDEVGGPAEQPPAGFSGQQYVDSRGCVFMRAGLDGQTNWVPRIDRDRQVICDRPPSLGPRPAPAVADVAEPAPPVTAARPAETVVAAAAIEPETPPRRVARPAPAAPVTAISGPRRKIGCFQNAPVPVRVRLADGGTTVLCTRGDGTLEGARVPVQVAQPGGPGQTAAPPPVDVGAPPPGYRAAWQDDRLNPQRGPRTAAGQAQQDQVWTREVPARAVPLSVTGRMSSKSEADAVKIYVQVGSFGVPDNAVRARATLRTLGLPTARAESQGLTIVFAGPFTTDNEARMARTAARDAGFGDAFIR